MIIKLNNENNIDIINYIGNEYYKCLYLYLDYKKYGFNDENIKIYAQQINNKTTAILLNYSTSLHIFSKYLDCDYKEIFNFIINNNYKSIFSEKEVIKKIANYDNRKYKSEYGHVWKINKIKQLEEDDITYPQIDDFEEIANLIMTDRDIASSYEYNDLVIQLKQRFLNKFGRNFIIKDNEKIIGHICTNAEIDNLAIVSLIIVDTNYRRKGIAKKLLSKITNELDIEGKQSYLINYSNESTALYEKMNLSQCCEYGKLYNE